MDIPSALNALFRWIHIIVGILWIGHLYFFNFVNTPIAAKLSGDAKKAVVPELMPRALFWFRWGAAWTWITGVLLLMLVFYHGGIMFEGEQGWGLAAIVMLAVVFGGVFIYDAIYSSPLAGNVRAATIVSFVLIAIVAVLMQSWANFSFRAVSIHLGAMFGTIMAFNVWFRIWPAQQKIITAVKNGEAPEASLAALAGGRSKHNTYLSVPLLWFMINQHTFAYNGWGIIGIMVLIALGWHIVFQLYKKAGKLEGF